MYYEHITGCIKKQKRFFVMVILANSSSRVYRGTITPDLRLVQRLRSWPSPEAQEPYSVLRSALVTFVILLAREYNSLEKAMDKYALFQKK